MLRKVSLAAALAFSGPAAMAANGWGIEFEKITVIEGKVVDLACALTGDCPNACGAGKRQMGLLTSDGKLRAIVKGPVDFANAVVDLSPYCGKTVQADGLLIENPAMQMFMVQQLREDGAQPWAKPTKFQSLWESANGKAGEWFRADPLVKRTLAEDGVFGVKGLAPPPEKK